MTWPRFSSGQPTHGVAEFGGTTDYVRIRGELPPEAKRSPELESLTQLSAWLFLSPLVLIPAWRFGQAGVHDMAISAQGWVLGLWALMVVAIASSQVTSRSLRLIALRKALLGLLHVATFGIAIGYVYVAQSAHAEARPGKPQRAFVYLEGRSRLGGMIPATFGFQLANGSNLAGGRGRKPFEYGSCVTAQLLASSYGFRWVRVTESTPSPGPGQLHWPVRREDCFSNIPLSEVRR